MQRLPVFLSAAEYLNFTKAAEVHCISQTAVSQQIKLLEQELGFQLFVREKRGVSLTPAGEAFYQQCKVLITQYYSAVARAQRIAAGNPDALRLGYASAYELWTVSGLVSRYCRRYPRRQVEFQDGSSKTIIDQIADGKVDIGVISLVGVVIPNWLSVKILLEEPCVLMISSTHPLASAPEIDPRDLKDIPIVLNSGANHRMSEASIIDMYTHLGLSDNKRLYAEDFYSLALLVNLGQAISIMPQGMEHMGIKGLSFVPIKNFHAKARTMIVYPRNRAIPAVKDLLDML